LSTWQASSVATAGIGKVLPNRARISGDPATVAAGCGQLGPKSVALRMPAQGVAGSGARKRAGTNA